MTTLKKRKIVLFITLASFALMVLFSFLDQVEIHNYTVETNKKYGSGAEIKDINYLSPILSLIFYGFWFIFAFIYIYSKNNARIRYRKWPYIVLIVFVSFIVLYYIYYIFVKFDKGIYVVDKNSINPVEFQKILDDEFAKNTIIKVYPILMLVSSIAFLSLLITSLVLIKKEKGEADIEYSKTVLETGENIQESKTTNAQEKSNLPNDLP